MALVRAADSEQEVALYLTAASPASASVESVRLDPELRRALAERAERDQESTSSIIRKALRSYLEAS